MIVSAGNESQAAINNGLAAIAADPLINGQVVIAGAINNLDALSDFSNFAGPELQDFFLSAPGEGVITISLNDILFSVSGTSFAAPHVSGAIALLWERFPNLSAQEIVEILFTSADDLGTIGTDTFFGRGKLNIGAALSPLGTLSLPMGTTVAQPGFDVASSAISLGSAFGDALAGQSLLSRGIVLDSFSRTFSFDLRDLIIRPGATPDLLLRARNSARRNAHYVRLSNRQSLSIAFSDHEAFTDGEAFSSTRSYLDLRESLTPRYRDLSFSFTTSWGRHAAVTVSGGTGFSGGTIYGDRHDGGGDLLSPGARPSPFAALVQQENSLALSYRFDNGTDIRLATAVGKPLDHSDFGSDRRAVGNVLSIKRKSESGASFGVEVGSVLERGGFLDSAARGAFDSVDGATTLFATVSGTMPIARNWLLVGQFSQGLTRIHEAGFELLSDFSSIRASGFNVGAMTFDLFQKGDWLAVNLSQPLRVDRASATLEIATGRDFLSDAIFRDTGTVDLAPSGREIDFELAYRIASRQDFSIQTNLLYQINPGHAAGAPGALSLFLEISKSF
ncbi:MAG: S8 family serine peptidase [Sphingomonadales bacterium]